jgi:hypothetical protein
MKDLTALRTKQAPWSNTPRKLDAETMTERGIIYSVKHEEGHVPHQVVYTAGCYPLVFWCPRQVKDVVGVPLQCHHVLPVLYGGDVRAAEGAPSRATSQLVDTNQFVISTCRTVGQSRLQTAGLLPIRNQ